MPLFKLLNGDLIDADNLESVADFLQIDPARVIVLDDCNKCVFISPLPVIYLQEGIHFIHNDHKEHSHDNLHFLQDCQNESILDIFLRERPIPFTLCANSHEKVVKHLCYVLESRNEFDLLIENHFENMGRNDADCIVDYMITHRPHQLNHSNKNSRVQRYLLEHSLQTPQLVTMFQNSNDPYVLQSIWDSIGDRALLTFRDHSTEYALDLFFQFLSTKHDCYLTNCPTTSNDDRIIQICLEILHRYHSASNYKYLIGMHSGKIASNPNDKLVDFFLGQNEKLFSYSGNFSANPNSKMIDFLWEKKHLLNWKFFLSNPSALALERSIEYLKTTFEDMSESEKMESLRMVMKNPNTNLYKFVLKELSYPPPIFEDVLEVFAENNDVILKIE